MTRNQPDKKGMEPVSTQRTLTATTIGPVCPDIVSASGTVDVVVDPGLRHARVVVRTDNDDGPTADAVRDTVLRERIVRGAPVIEIHVPEPAGAGSSPGVRIGNMTIGAMSGVVGGTTTMWIDGVRVASTSTGASTGEITIEVRLPAYSSLRARTTSADLRITGHLQTLGATTVSGDVRADIVDTLAARSTSGTIRANRVTDRLDAVTVSGAIAVGSYGGGEFTARTTSGDITVTAGPTARGVLAATSVSGDIHTRDTRATTRLDVHARTVSGDIRHR
jgi:hypothetical protein